MSIAGRELTNLRSLSMLYPSVQAAEAQAVNLRAKLDLPGRTEHFISDIHGEYDTFCHVLRTASGTIDRAIEDVFGSTLSESDRWHLATLVSYPEKKIPVALYRVDDEKLWFRTALQRLSKLCSFFCSRHTHATVLAFLPAHYSPIIEELLYRPMADDKGDYRQSVIDSIIATNCARAIVITLAELVQRLAVTRLHIIGDIYDRGPGAHQILDKLLDHHGVDIQWGNHDIVWMGAAAGSEACIANVVRICLRYANLATLENAYGVSLLPLASLAIEAYGDDPCGQFKPKVLEGESSRAQELQLLAQMQKAIAVIQFKLEGQVILRRPQFEMTDRLLLDKIDTDRATVRLNDVDYSLADNNFPTVDIDNPYELTSGEKSVVEKLKLSFVNSDKLQAHVRFLFSSGSMYLVHNGNLLYHGCIAMNEDGSFMEFEVAGEKFSGKAFMDRVDGLARQGYFSTDAAQKLSGLDAMWYLWSGAQSPLFGKEKMATFERYFIVDKSTHVESRNAYYELRYSEDTAKKILNEFGIDSDTARIVNGHVPVKAVKGESPIKANGRLLVIDGGFSRAYQSETGIAGYSLVDSSNGLLLVAHHPFESADREIEELQPRDVETWLAKKQPPQRVSDTDEGLKIEEQLVDLQCLLKTYRDSCHESTQGHRAV